jgi:transcriptional regulator with XRE-family HTH domain
MSNFIQKFDARMEKDKDLKKLYLEERLILRVTNVISELMEEQNIKKVDLAERVGCSKGYITQILDGTANLTLKTISNVLFELGSTLAVKAEPIKEFTEGRSERFTFLITNYSTAPWRGESNEHSPYTSLEKERIPA